MWGRLGIVIAFVILLAMPMGLASTPTITVNSPQNKTYNTTDIILNISTDVISNVFFQLNDNTNTSLYYNNFNGTINLGAFSSTNKPLQGSNKVFISAENGTDNANQTVFFSVDTIPPTVNLRSPQNSFVTDSPFQTFEFVPIDPTSSTMACFLYLNSGQIAGPVNVVNETLGRISKAIPAGSHQWSIGCKDNLQNLGTSSRNIIVSSKCGIDAIELTGKSDQLSMILKNTGTLEEEIDYTIKVDLNETVKGYAKLGAGESKEVLHNFTFKVGNYLLESTAIANCGSQDYISAGYAKIQGPSPCTNPLGQHGDYRRDVDNVTIFKCNNGFWITIASGTTPYCTSTVFSPCGDQIVNCGETASSCPQDYTASAVAAEIALATSCNCTNKYVKIGERNGTIQEFYDSCKSTCALPCAFDYHCQNGYVCTDFKCVARLGKCGVEIQDFDYVKQMATGETGKMFATIKNTGMFRENIKVNLTAGIKDVGSDSFDLNPGKDKLVEFSYKLGTGSYGLKLQALADCGATEKKTATVSVVNISISSLPDFALATDVSLYKNNIETVVGAERPIQLNIKTTKPQIFNLKVSGVPDSWLSYPSTVGVTEDRHINIFVKPDAAGEFNVTVFVYGTEQNFTSIAFFKSITVAEKIAVSQKMIIVLLVSVVVLFSLALFLATRVLHLQESN